MKKTLATLAALVTVLPLAASAQTYYANTTTSTQVGTQDQSALQAQIEELLQKVMLLQQQMGASGTASAGAGSTGSTGTAQGVSGLAQQAGVQVVDSSSCPQIGRSLRNGATGDDVTRLQQFLARDPSIYPEGTVSGFYGSLTEAAVRRWQVKYNIVSSGSAETTGYGVVGPRTAAAISLQCSTYGGGSGVSAPVGGYIQVSPISGNAPLTVNVQATVNTTNSCGSASYSLNWGDNTPNQNIPVSANSCTQASQTYTHVYQYGGTYLMTLSAGGHRTSATVTVYGLSAPTSVVQQTSSGGTALPPETFAAAPLSGNAPLTVTFSGVVSSADYGWCATGCSSVLVFGDGITGSVPLPTAQGSYQTYSLTHSYTAPGTYTAVLYQGQVASGRTVGGTVTINVTGTSNTYGPFTVTPGTGGNPHSITASFSLPSSCTGYQLSWGDGTTDVTQTDGGSSCAQASVSQSFTHQYSAGGSYSITLKRGPTLSTVDTATLSITN